MQLTEGASYAMSCYTEGFTMLQHSKNMSYQLYAGVATEGFTTLQHSKNMPRQFYAGSVLRCCRLHDAAARQEHDPLCERMAGNDSDAGQAALGPGRLQCAAEGEHVQRPPQLVGSHRPL